MNKRIPFIILTAVGVTGLLSVIVNVTRADTPAPISTAADLYEHPSAARLTSFGASRKPICSTADCGTEWDRVGAAVELHRSPLAPNDLPSHFTQYESDLPADLISPMDALVGKFLTRFQAEVCPDLGFHAGPGVRKACTPGTELTVNVVLITPCDIAPPVDALDDSQSPVPERGLCVEGAVTSPAWPEAVARKFPLEPASKAAVEDILDARLLPLWCSQGQGFCRKAS